MADHIDATAGPGGRSLDGRRSAIHAAGLVKAHGETRAPDGLDRGSRSAPAPPQVDELRRDAMDLDGYAAIRVRNLRKAYGGHDAVHGVSFDVPPGEVFGFLGPNGAGKTTTIEILEGYRARTAGDVRVLGVDPGRPTRCWRERIGLVLQECELDPNLTVRETVGLLASFYPSPLRSTRRSSCPASGTKRAPASAPCPVARSGGSTWRSASSATPTGSSATSPPPGSTRRRGGAPGR